MLRANFAVAEDDVFLRGQAVQAYGAAGVEFVGGDADLGAEPEFGAVGEGGGGVPEHGAGVDKAQEVAAVAVAFGDYGVGMVRAVVVDVLDGFVGAIDYLYGEDGREVFAVVVVFAGGDDAVVVAAGARATAEFDALQLQGFDY